MNTVKLNVPNGYYSKVVADIKKNEVKYYPIRKIFGGHRFEIEDNPIVSYLILKYDCELFKE